MEEKEFSPLDVSLDKELEEQVFQNIKEVEGLLQHLREILNNDILLYFQASNDRDRDLIRGAYMRTMSIRNKIIKAQNLQNVK